MTDQPMRVFILTGDPSGDLHGAYLARALRRLEPALRLSGVGGARMREAGVELAARSEGWGAIGIPASLRRAPALLYQLGRLTRLLRADPPDALVLIDFGAFNMRVAEALRGSGIRAVYYFPPGSWSRHRPAGRLPFLVDAVATPFPWSAENLRAAGGPARIEWVGHPLLEYCRVSTSREDARRQLGVDAMRPALALAPGSRRAEIRHLLPVFLAAARRLSPTPHCLLPAAPSVRDAVLRRALPADLPITVLNGMEYEVIQAADAALAASGTVTLELACLDIPMVVAYRGSLATWLQYRIAARGGRLRFAALPNILADAPVVPELLQGAATPANLAAAVTPLLRDGPARRAQLAAFSQIRGMLGDGDACARTAALILDVAAPARA